MSIITNLLDRITHPAQHPGSIAILAFGLAATLWLSRDLFTRSK